MFSWFKSRCTAARRLPAALRLEALEDRWVPSPITHVRDIGAANGNSVATLKILAPAAGVAAGDTVFVEVVENGSIGIGVSVGDARGNTYHADLIFNTSVNPTAIFSAPITTALVAGDAITVTFSGAAPTEAAATAFEFSGIAATTALDQTQNGTGTSSTPTSGQTATTAQAKELLLGIVEVNATTNTSATPPTITFTPGANYAGLPAAQSTASFSPPPPQASLSYTLQVAPEFQVVGAAGKYQADGTLAVSAGNSSWAAGIATYRASDTTAQFTVTSSTATPIPGVPFSLTVTAQDGANATATGYTGTVHLTSSDGQALLPADYVFTSADKGTHTFTNVTLKTLGTQTVTAADTNPVAGFNANVAVTVKQAATHFGLTTSTATPVAGTPFTLTVAALDATNAAFPGYTGTVHFTSLDGQASLPADYTFTAADKGVHTFSLTLKTVGTQGVTVSDPGTGTVAGSLTATVNPTVLTLNQKFVTNLYLDLLGRPVDAAGLAFWSKALDAGTDRSQVVAQIEQSPEYLGNQANKAFNLLLKRNLDDNGRSFFVKFLQGGGTDEQMIALIAGSPEYFTTRAKGDANAYVQSIFQDLLSRPLDANGQAFFSKSLSNGATRDQIATAILTSLEYRKNLVAADYQTVLRRGPDFGAVDWVVLLLQGSTDETITAGIFASSEYYNRP